MAGTLFGLPRSQQHDLNGRPLIGAKLYIYTAGTLTPANAYANSGLTVLLPHPIETDANGRLPAFWLADGSYRARFTDSAGNVQFDDDSILAIGPSSGGGGGGTVDANALASTGDVKFRPQAGTLAGWVRLNGRTIGSATSGATERANADTQPLYEYKWSTFSDTLCPVVGGRGISAAADFAANKAITTLDARSCAFVGLDDMGNTAAGRNTDTSFTSVTSAGLRGGAARHTLVVGEMPAHNHGGATGAQTTIVQITAVTAIQGNLAATGGVRSEPNAPSTVTIPDHAHSIASQGGGGAHNNMPPAILGTWYMKL